MTTVFGGSTYTVSPYSTSALAVSTASSASPSSTASSESASASPSSHSQEASTNAAIGFKGGALTSVIAGAMIGAWLMI
jgi:hypothetical protein